jgi:HAD superfamily hydrolase (TIGR01509 family)
MPRLRAVLWDVDGTLAETERDGHRVAFNQAFEICGLAWRWGETTYGQLLAVTGGRERLLHDMRHRPDAPASPTERDALAQRVHEIKNRCYAELVDKLGIPLRPGVRELVDEVACRGAANAIVTTTSRANVDALLGKHLGRRWADGFAAVVCAEDVQRKKPDPAAYLEALARLRLEAADAIAIEDAPAGVTAARSAGCAVIVTRSVYFDQAEVSEAAAIGPGLHSRAGWRPALTERPCASASVGFDDLQRWWAGATRHAR